MKFSRFSSRSKHEMKFFQTLPLGSYLVFLGGIYFLFAMVGIVSSLMGPGRMSYGDVAIVCAFSGLIGALYAHTFIRDIRFLLVVIPLHVWLAIGFPGNGDISLVNASAHAYLRFHGLGILLMLVLSYALLIRFIGKQGLGHYKLKTEVDLARRLHSILVPDIDQRSGDHEISGFSRPVGEVGGDMVDSFSGGSGAVTITVADVSGHGVSAGAFMGMFKSALRTSLSQGYTTGESFRHVNGILYELKEKKMFLTAAAVSLKGDMIEYTVAGHLPILFYSKEDNRVDEITIKQIPIGMKREFKFGEANASFRRGDVVLMLTDGVTETFSRKKEQFGMERVKNILLANCDKPASGIVEQIIKEVEEFGEPSDDLTIVAIRHN